MPDNAACREKLAAIAVGSAVASFAVAGAPLPPGVLEAAAGGFGLLTALRGKRAADRDALVSDLADSLAADWRAWGDGADTAARASARQSFADVIDRCQPEPGEIVGLRLDADALAAAMLRRAEAALPSVYADRNPRNADAHLARGFFVHVTTRAYARLLANAKFVDRLAPDLWRGLFERMDEIAEAVAALPAEIGLVVEAAVQKLRDEGKARDRLILAFIRSATDKEIVPDQIEATLFEMAVEWRAAQGRAGGGAMANLTPDLSDLRAEADAAYAADDVERFWTLLTRIEQGEQAAFDALTARARDIEAEKGAMRAALVETKRRAIATAVARLDATAVATRVAEIVTLETPDPAARFNALRTVFIEWYERGRDRGLNFDLAVSIEIARLAQAQAGNADERGAVLNDLGAALQTLGARDAGTTRLEEAVAAYRAALEEWTRDRVPLYWATTRNNLGNALRTLGERESGTARLEEAVAAYREALAVFEAAGATHYVEVARANLARAEALIARRRGEGG